MYALMQQNQSAKKSLDWYFPAMTQEPPLISGAKQVGRGVFGKVYRAMDINRKAKVAIKRVQKYTNHMSREIEILYALRRKPHCVQMKNFFFTYDGRNIVENMILEYIPMTLEDMLQDYAMHNKQFSTEQILKLMKELLQGMCQIHSEGVLHRDIKPDNIFITSDLKVVKFGDFGASKFQNNYSPSYPTRVSKSYRAPQLMCGTSIHTGKIDIWSLGCVFLELFTLYPFFDRKKSDPQQFYHVIESRGGFNKEVAKSICRLFLDQTHALKIKKEVFSLIPSSRKMTIPEMLSERGFCPTVPKGIYRVIEKMIEPDPFMRYSAQQLLDLARMEKIFDSVN